MGWCNGLRNGLRNGACNGEGAIGEAMEMRNWTYNGVHSGQRIGMFNGNAQWVYNDAHKGGGNGVRNGDAQSIRGPVGRPLRNP